MTPPWIRFPTVRGETLAFVTDDDVFTAPLAGGIARRVTSGVGAALRPRFSPDGATLTWDSTADGVRDVYRSEAAGGPVQRLTFGGATNLGFDPAGRPVVSLTHGRPFPRQNDAAVLTEQNQPHRLPFGSLTGLAAAASGRLLLCRHAVELGFWRGYRGGRLGVLWLGVPRGSATDWREVPLAWEKVTLPCAAASPTWCAGRFWFVGDPGSAPELCSIDERGGDFRTHTELGGFGVRHAHSDGTTLVFVHDGALYRWTDDGPREIPLDVAAQRTDRQRRTFSAARYLEDFDLHPDGHSVALSVRGRVFTMGFWDGPVRSLGEPDGVRHLFPRWLDAERIAVFSDRSGEYELEVHGPGSATRSLPGPHGRPVHVAADPTGRKVAVVDHTHRLHVVHLESGVWTELDHAPPGGIGVDWSSDGGALAWSRPSVRRRGSIRVHVFQSSQTIEVTDGSWDDWCPSFDPEGNHLYFLSVRDFDPVPDQVTFGYGLPRGARPYCVPLRRDVPHPFRPEPRPLKSSSAKSPERGPTVIEADGLAERVVPFPVPEARWRHVIGVSGGHVLLVREAVQGTLHQTVFADGPPKTEGTLCAWDPEKQELFEVTTRMGGLRVDARREHAVWQSGWRLRVALARPDKSAREELKKTDGRAERKTGWLDLSRVRTEVDPEREWPQMLRESHRLMRDHFWQQPTAEELRRGDEARDRATALLPRIGTRSELSDLITFLQGGWGTSHAYEMGGDLPMTPRRTIGWLGADLAWDNDLGGYRVDHILRGDAGTDRSSPLTAPGAGVRAGDVIVAIDGRRVSPDRALAADLADRALVPVVLEIAGPEDGATRRALVVPLASDRELRYRDWVLGRRDVVTARSAGRAGYLHIPNMGPSGFAELHRDWHHAIDHEALVVDVRNNGGGHVSSLLLRKLAQRRLGRSDPRHGTPRPYPWDSPPGTMVLLTNESAGSDGDIFTHAWRQLGLGKVFGTRTWGGVVGIRPTLRLVDRTLTTQPEYATWFEDVGYAIENRGAEVDVEIERTPDIDGTTEDPVLELALIHLVRTADEQRDRLGTAPAVR